MKIFTLLFSFALLTPCWAHGQEESLEQEETAASDASALGSMFQRLESLDSQLQLLEQTPEPNLEVLKERREQAARDLQSEIDQVEQEIHRAITGVEESSFQTVFEAPPTDLQAELFEFLEPFFLILRSATAESREIEVIRRELTGLGEQKELATSALDQLGRAASASASSQGARRVALP